ncbi:MAG: hypothetical protein JXA66_04845, partial [Oligoflexia bacterium]|nr:hypothetical protein [Oligoflexia bacterium]
VMVAKILKEQGMYISAYTFNYNSEIGNNCNMDTAKATDAAGELEIELHTEDISDVFFAEVVDDFICSRLSGKVTNPCFMCKVAILRQLYARTIRERADFLALGAFGRNESFFSMAKEETMDQSNLLAFSGIPADRLMLPIGGFLARDLIRLAFNMGIEDIETYLAVKNTSCCLTTKAQLAELSVYVPSFMKGKGQVVNNQEYVIGYHNGIFYSTVGETVEYTPVRGKNLSSFESTKVVEIKPEQNTIIVGNETALQKNKAVAVNIHWFRAPALYKPREFVIRFDNGETEKASLFYSIANTALLEFSHVSINLSRGRKAAFYENRELMGRGEIGPLIKEELYI